MADTDRQPERIWVELPLSIDAVVAVTQGVSQRWPDAVVVTDHGRDGNWLCVELRGDTASPYGDEI